MVFSVCDDGVWSGVSVALGGGVGEVCAGGSLEPVLLPRGSGARSLGRLMGIR